MEAKKPSKSKTITWGHLQFVGGALVYMIDMYNPIWFPDIPGYVYGIALMVKGLITYGLRLMTTMPLDSPLAATPPEDKG